MTKEQATIAAAQKIHELLFHLQQDKIPTLLLVSGGSALGILDQIEASVVDTFLTVGVLDERFSADPAINNFTQFMKTRLYEDGVKAGVRFINTVPVAGETIEQLAARFEGELKNWRTQNPNGKIIITQGMGQDGHTSGILPFPENPGLFAQLFEQPDKWVVSYDAGAKNQYPLRVTTTMSFLKKVDYSIFFVCGEDKLSALNKVYAKDGNLADTPGRIVHELLSFWLYTDQTGSFQI